MKLLLDENVPVKLKQDLLDFDVFTVKDMGWNGVKNGELLKLITNNKFDLFITFDRNIEHQHHIPKFGIRIIVLVSKSNSYLRIKLLLEKIIQEIENPTGDQVVQIS